MIGFFFKNYHPLYSNHITVIHRFSRTVRDRASSYNIDYIIVIKSFLNPKGHQDPLSGSKVMAILLKGWVWPIGEASAGEGLRLQPAQQACF